MEIRFDVIDEFDISTLKNGLTVHILIGWQRLCTNQCGLPWEWNTR